MKPAIQVDNLSKQYRIGAAQTSSYRTLRESLAETASSALRTIRSSLRGKSGHNKAGEEFWALRDVSFEVQPGEVVGIIGRNGAGKSTLLKILSRITEPTSGRAVLRGRVSSLLEVGTGFHPELTGRENIYLNGGILGMKRSEISRKFDEIVAFAGTEQFLDTPVKRYSSGMYVRLAFAVAAHLEPEILIIDEVLAVGDAEFQKKCLGKMQDVAQAGRTVLFVSHNMPAIRALTSKSAYFKGGHLHTINATSLALEAYLSDCVRKATASKNDIDYYRRDRDDQPPVLIEEITLKSDRTKTSGIAQIASGKPLTISFTLNAHKAIPKTCISITLIKNHENIATTIFSLDTTPYFSLTPGVNYIACTIEDLSLTPGRYSINVGVNENATSIAYDVVLDYPLFEVYLPGLESGEIDWHQRPWGAVHVNAVRWLQS